MPARFHHDHSWPVSAAVLLVLTLAAPVAAQDSSSAAAAKDFSAAMDAAKLDAIAAADPAEPGRYVAALYFSGSQVLAVSAKYSVPVLLQTKLENKNYRDIYIDLNSASEAGTKVFVIDAGADGLRARPDNGVVDNYEDAAHQVAFDGEGKDAKLSDEQYKKVFQDADAKYAHILSLLTAQARGSSSN